MGKFIKFFIGVIVLILSACDLQPKITSIPDSVGEFISNRYPALLADPKEQPEIYNSAAADYGVYASPELYGNGDINDYILYSSVDDYTLKQSPVKNKPVNQSYMAKQTPPPVPDDYLTIPVYKTIPTENTIKVAKGDTVYSLARKNSMTVDEFAELNNLAAPYKLSVGQVLRVSGKSVITEVSSIQSKQPDNIKTSSIKATKVELTEIKVSAGDTLYSISRNYSIPVNDLAVMNKLSAPFTLSIGQKLRVPKLKESATSVSSIYGSKSGASSSNATTVAVDKPKEKISSDPKKALPKIASRSSSKFAWPVRGKTLSGFGSKSNGLFNDGINIGAKLGTKVSAAENGVVAYAGNELKGMGNLVIVQHAGGWMTVYAHMDKMSVRRGIRVTVGQQIGTVGQTGKVDGPQLHFEIRKGTKSYNPSKYMKN